MTNTLKKQSGRALVIGVVVISIAVLGALAYVLWNNFIREDENTSQPVTTQQEAVVTKDEINLSENYTLPGENLNVSYPASWTATKEYRENDYGNDNSLELTNAGGTVINVSIPSYGPDWQFGERIFGCPFDKNYSPNNTFNQPSLCPVFGGLLSTKLPNLDNALVYAFSRTYPSGSTAEAGVDFVVAKEGCKGTDSELCQRPGAKTGFYILAGTTVEPESNEEYMKSAEAKEIIAILSSLKY